MSLRLLIYYAKMTGTTLDMLVGDMIPEYRDDVLDNTVLEAIKSLSAAQKEKLLRILEILKEIRTTGLAGGLLTPYKG